MRNIGFSILLLFFVFEFACKPSNENVELVDYLKSNDRFFGPPDSTLIDLNFIIENERVSLSFESISRDKYYQAISKSEVPVRFEYDSV